MKEKKEKLLVVQTHSHYTDLRSVTEPQISGQ